MKSANPAHGRIIEHDHGVGAATPEMVTQRAREIAMTNGRQPNHYLPDDLAQAKRELIGSPDSGPGDQDGVAELTEWDESPDAAGHAVAKSELLDEQTLEEELVEEGINEAEHEQMVEGSKNHRH